MKHFFALIATMIIGLTFMPQAQASGFRMNCSAADGAFADFVLDANNRTVSFPDDPDFQIWTLMWNDQHISWVMKLEHPAANDVTVLSYLLARESGVLIATALLASDATEARGITFEYLCRRPL